MPIDASFCPTPRLLKKQEEQIASVKEAALDDIRARLKSPVSEAWTIW
jgi:hypothetical protein